MRAEMQKRTLPAGADVYQEGASPQLFMGLAAGTLGLVPNWEISLGKRPF